MDLLFVLRAPAFAVPAGLAIGWLFLAGQASQGQRIVARRQRSARATDDLGYLEADRRGALHEEVRNRAELVGGPVAGG